MTFLLFTLLLIIFLIALLFSRGVLIRPGVIVSGIMLFSGLSAICLSFVWDFELSGYTIFLISASVLSIVLGDTLSTFIIRGNFKIRRELPTITINNLILCGVLFFQFAVVVFHLKYLISNVGYSGSLLMTVNTYRNYQAWGIQNDMIDQMSGLLSRSIRLSNNFGFIYLYILINNIIKTKNVRRNLKYSLPCIYVGIYSILCGARGYFFYLIFAGIIYFYTLYILKNGYNQKSTLMMIKKVGKYVVIAIVLFVATAYLFGRSTKGSILMPVYRYLGGGIPLFNEYIKDSYGYPNTEGEITFFSFFNFLNRKIGTNYNITAIFEYRNGDWGNIYTGVRRYFQDFGVSGVIWLSLLFGFIFGLYYNHIFKKKKAIIKPFNLSIIFFGIVGKAIFLFFMDDLLFTLYFTPSTIVIIIELWICIKIVKYKSRVVY